MHRTLGWLLVCALAAALTLVQPTTVQATGPAQLGGRLTVSPAAPVAGQPFTVRGSTSTKARRLVRLDVLRGTVWRTTRRTHTTSKGTFAFTLAASAATRLRVVAPGTKRPRTPPWTSATRLIRPVVQRATITLPGTAEASATVSVRAAFVPPRAGRKVWLQRHTPTGWSTVRTSAQSSSGRATFALVAPSPGRYTYRVAAAVHDGIPNVVSPAAHLTTTPVVDEPELEPLPRVEITTDDAAPITSGTDYAHATMTIDPRGSKLPAYSGTSRFRVRGNSTSWVRYKLSYKVKLDAKSPVLGMPGSKDWVLLANFYDRSLLRNTAGFEVSRRMGLAWTPHLMDVELWQNGTFQGLYQLGESIEVASDRVDIETPEDGDPSGGGFLLEGDSWPDDGPSFTTDRGLQLFVKEPEDMGEAYVGGVRAWVQRFEDALYADGFADPDTGYRAYVDVDSFADWYLANEVMKTIDAPFKNSVWMYRDVGGKLTMGPAWDFDQSSGNRQAWQLDDPTGWFLGQNWWTVTPAKIPSQFKGPDGHWLNRMLEDPAFVALVEARWQEVRESMLTLPTYVAQSAAPIAGAAERNFAAQPEGAGMPIGETPLDPAPEHVFHGSWPAERDALQAWLTARMAWMDDQLTP